MKYMKTFTYNFENAITSVNHCHRKYKDYIFGKCLYSVLDKNRKHCLRCKDKAEKSYDVSRGLRHMQLHMSKYQIIRFTIHDVKPIGQLLFKVDFQKVDKHTGSKWLIHDTKRRKDNQLQSLKLLCRIS